MNLGRRALLVMLLLILSVSLASAAQMEWSEEPFSYYANDDRIDEIIKNILGDENIPVVLKDDFDETITANFFNSTRKEIFEQIANVYGLQWFYDGHVLYVDRVGNARMATIQLSSTPVQVFKEHLIELGVLDDRFHWQMMPAQGVVVVGGPDEFIDRVRELANLLDAEYSSYQTFYRWQDESGVTHISSDPKLAPGNASITRLERAGGDDAATPASQVTSTNEGDRRRDNSRAQSGDREDALKSILTQVNSKSRSSGQ